MFVGNYDGLQKGYKICQLSRKIAFKSIPFSTIFGDICTNCEPMIVGFYDRYMYHFALLVRSWILSTALFLRPAISAVKYAILLMQ